MKWIPQISLRSLFALFFCAAVGLTVGTIESAVATAVAIGLIQQVRQLLGWSPCANESLSELAFARRFAIAWRLSAAAMTSTLLIAYMFASRGLLQFPDHDDVWYYWQEQTVLAFCVILAFCNSIARWQSDSPTGTMRWRPVVALWTIGILVGFVAIIDGTTTQFLIHKAVAGVEAAIPQQFQRPEVYPNLGDERYLTLWLAFAAVVSVLAAGALLVQRSKTAVSWRSLTTTNSLYALLLVAPGMFCYWYYTAEYHRLSPDIAGAGLAANWVNSVVPNSLFFMRFR